MKKDKGNTNGHHLQLRNPQISDEQTLWRLCFIYDAQSFWDPVSDINYQK